MPKWPNLFTKEAVREVVSQIIWSYWPYWGAPLMGGILGYLGGYPPLVIFLSAIGAFAIVSVALNNFSQWLALRTAADKIHILVPVAGIKQDESKSPAELLGVKLGIMVRNSANFPIEVRLDNLETKILDRIPSDDFFVRSMMISEGEMGRFHNSLIDLSGINKNDALFYGRIEAKISYGRKNNLRYSAEKQWHLAIKFDQNGNLRNIEPSFNEFSEEVVKKVLPSL